MPSPPLSHGPPAGHLLPWLEGRSLGCPPPYPRLSHPLTTQGLPYRSSLVGHTKCVNTVQFSRIDRRFLVSGSDDQRLLVWDIFERPARQTPRAAYHGHTGIVLCAVWDPCDQHLLSCGTDETVLRFDVNRGDAPVNSFGEHDDGVQKVCYRPESAEIFVSASTDSTLRLWDCRLARSQGAIFGLCPFSAAAFCPTSDHLFVSSDQASGLLLWDLRRSFGPTTTSLGALASAQQTRRRALLVYRGLHRHRSGFLMPPEVSAVDFCRDGTRFVCSVRKCAPLVFETAHPTPVLECHATGYANKVTQKTASFVGDHDEMVACGSDDWGVYLWNLRDVLPSTGEPTTHQTGDGSGSWSNAAAVLPRAAHVLRGHQSIVNTIAWTPTLPLLATAGVERVIKLWQPHPFAAPSPTEPPYLPRRPYQALDAERLASQTSIHIAAPTPEEVEEGERQTLALFDYYTHRFASDSDAEPSLDDNSAADDDSDSDTGPEGEEEESSGSSTGSHSEAPGQDPRSPSSLSSGSEGSVSIGSPTWAAEQRLLRRAAAWQAMRAMARQGDHEALQNFKPDVTRRSLWDMLDSEEGDTGSETADLLRLWPTRELDTPSPPPTPPPSLPASLPPSSAPGLQWAEEQCRRLVRARWAGRVLPTDPRAQRHRTRETSGDEPVSKRRRAP